MVPTVSMAAASEFQQEEPEKERLVLYRSMRGLGNVYLSGLLLLALKRERDYVGGYQPLVHFKYQHYLVQLFLQR